MKTIRTLTALCAALLASFTFAGEESAKDDSPHPYLGVFLTNVPEVVSSQLGLDSGVGIVVEKVVKDGPASLAGIAKNDILIRFDDQILIGTKQITVLIKNSAVGAEHQITFLRAGQEQQATVTLQESPSKKEQAFFGEDLHKMEFLEQLPSREELLASLPNREELLAQLPSREELMAQLPSEAELRAQVETQIQHVMQYAPEDGEGGPKIITLSGDVDELVERIQRATQSAVGMKMPTVVIKADERVFNFTDDDGKSYIITDQGDTSHLTIIDEKGENLYNGTLDDATEAELPEAVKATLSSIQTVAAAPAPPAPPTPPSVWSSRSESL